MKFKELGATGEKLSCIGIGTWKLGYNPSEDVRIIREGIGLGVNFIDTAELYHTEQIVGEAIKGKDVFVATKVSPNHFRYDDVISACNNSLRNLGIKTIDLYQLHWPNPNIPITETMKAMEKLVKDGKIRYIGVSNFSIEEIEAAQDSLKSERIVSNQVEYSVFVREIADYLMPFCKKERISIIAYSPLGSGAMPRVRSTELFRLLESMGKKYDKTAAQVALNWLISKEYVIPIPKASSSVHIRENIESANFSLSRADISKIDQTTDDTLKPLASKLTDFTKSTTSFWSKIMERRERLRKHGI